MPKIAINGFGRIGQLAYKRILDNHTGLEVAAVNDLRDKKTLLKGFVNDPVYGEYKKEASASFFAEKDPAKLPWKKLGVDIVLECSGYFTDLEGAQRHIKAGAKKVVISAPSKSDSVPTYLLGVNAQQYDAKKERIVSMGSCTTNALAPVAKILDQEFGIVNGFLNTVHSYTTGQNKIYPDWHKAPASQLSIIPATTGATKTVEKCLPQLKGKLNGLALRVPTATVSIVDFTIQVEKRTTSEKVNEVLRKMSQSRGLKGILKVEDKQMVSRDYIGSVYSSIVDGNLTQAFGSLLKVLIWYDNEYGYACRLAEFAELVAESD